MSKYYLFFDIDQTLTCSDRECERISWNQSQTIDARINPQIIYPPFKQKNHILYSDIHRTFFSNMMQYQEQVEIRVITTAAYEELTTLEILKATFLLDTRNCVLQPFTNRKTMTEHYRDHGEMLKSKLVESGTLEDHELYLEPSLLPKMLYKGPEIYFIISRINSPDIDKSKIILVDDDIVQRDIALKLGYRAINPKSPSYAKDLIDLIKEIQKHVDQSK